jgi:hypothetical protein
VKDVHISRGLWIITKNGSGKEVGNLYLVFSLYELSIRKIRLYYQIEENRDVVETKIGDGDWFNKSRTARFVRCGKYSFDRKILEI